ncbi:MAG: class I SAM-dependent methyltransferase [Patescibacteria group bacterium]
METPKEYVQRYYESYSNGHVDEEIRATGTFLAQSVEGVVLDCGCGPVPQLWAIFMPHATEIQAVDLPEESISFVEEKLRTVEEWYGDFEEYKKEVETLEGLLPEDYILKQIQKIKGVQQADMSASLPFSDGYFDTVISLYSLGCLKDAAELERAITHIDRVLKPGGKLLHINTDGHNKNETVPAYTWNGIDQSSKEIERLLTARGFTDMHTAEQKLPADTSGMYAYSAITLFSATKAADS